jgi:hypothetical protein
MLVIDISINRKIPITSIGARRISPKGDVDDDEICEYEVGRIFDGRIKRPLGKLKHRYGDGAEALAEKAIGIVKNHSSTSEQEEAYEKLIKLASNDMANLEK